MDGVLPPAYVVATRDVTCYAVRSTLLVWPTATGQDAARRGEAREVPIVHSKLRQSFIWFYFIDATTISVTLLFSAPHL